MNDAVATALALGLLFVGLPVASLVLRDRLSARGRARESGAADVSHGQRLLVPDWLLVEERLGRPVPVALLKLYADSPLITRRDLAWTDDQMISAFVPLDREAVTAAADWPGEAAILIAMTDFGDAVFLRRGAGQDDCVYLAHHDGGDVEMLAPSVAAMHAVLRKKNGPSLA